MLAKVYSSLNGVLMMRLKMVLLVNQIVQLSIIARVDSSRRKDIYERFFYGEIVCGWRRTYT